MKQVKRIKDQLPVTRITKYNGVKLSEIPGMDTRRRRADAQAYACIPLLLTLDNTLSGDGFGLF